MDLGLNNLQRLICHKTQQTKPTKAILVEEQQWYYLTHNKGDKLVHTFLKCIITKVNIITQQEFEFAHCKVEFKHVCLYTSRTPILYICFN